MKASEEERPEDESLDSPCLDWIVVSGNCHYAKDRPSFKITARLEYPHKTTLLSGTWSMLLESEQLN